MAVTEAREAACQCENEGMWLNGAVYAVTNGPWQRLSQWVGEVAMLGAMYKLQQRYRVVNLY